MVYDLLPNLILYAAIIKMGLWYSTQSSFGKLGIC